MAEDLKMSVYLNGERMEDQALGRNMFLDACRPTPKAMEGTWNLTAPDGRTWTADSPLKCCSLEIHERVSADVRLARIMREAAKPDPEDELRARIEKLLENNAKLAAIAVELGEQRDRLSAENAALLVRIAVLEQRNDATLVAQRDRIYQLEEQLKELRGGK